MTIKRNLDRVDALVAAILAAVLVIWGFVWAHPYPHPDLWPFLSNVRNYVSLGVLAVSGKFALGLFGVLSYLIMRSAWVNNRDPEDDLPDNFMLTRAVPLCAAIAFTCLPATWRSAQFLSPGFAFLVAGAFGFFLWQCGRGYRSMTAYTFAFLILGFIGGLNPLAIGALGYAFVTDFLARWRESFERRRKDDDEDSESEPDDGRSVKNRDTVMKGSMEITMSVSASLVGFGASILVGSVYFAGELIDSNLPDLLMGWWNGWLGSIGSVLSTTATYLMVFGVAAAAIATAVGRRLRANGASCRVLARTASGLLALFTLGVVCRSVDHAERVRLALIRDFLACVADDVKDVQWFFTDGRFDDILRFEFARRGVRAHLLDSLNAPSAKEVKRLRSIAPEASDRDVFAAGGAEIFKSWARERPDRLKTSAWQIGSGVIRRFGKLAQRPCGAVIRSDETTPAEKCDASDKRFAQFARALLDVVGITSHYGMLFGGVDSLVSARFDAVLWRAARMSSERSDRASALGQTSAAQLARDVTIQLDRHNVTLRAQGAALERLLPTANLVLTPREALDISLRRADFELAQRYAHEVLASSPNDKAANFAIGMSSLESENFFAAARHFEVVLKQSPKDAATLNNLSLAYLKLGQIDKAKSCVERAAEIYPKSTEIQKNLKRILKEAPQKSEKEKEND